MTPTVAILAPLTGIVMDLNDVPDEVFARGMLGPGAAINPDPVAGHMVGSPVSGTIVKLYPHAFVIKPEPDSEMSRVAVLVHLGLDTMYLPDSVFTVQAREGAVVQAGDIITHWSPTEITDAGLSPITTVVLLEATSVETYLKTKPGATIVRSQPFIGANTPDS